MSAAQDGGRPVGRDAREDGMDHEELATRMLEAAAARLEAVQTYACVVLCQERIAGEVRPRERIASVFRAPGSVYLRWDDGPLAGLQTSHVPERDGAGRFKARAPGIQGLFGALTLACDSPLVTAMNPHHFHTHETSVPFLVGLASRMVARARAARTIRVRRVDAVHDDWLGGEATCVDAELTAGPDEPPRWRRVQLFFEPATGLPLHLRLDGQDGELFGEYAFTQFVPGVDVPAGAFELGKS